MTSSGFVVDSEVVWSEVLDEYHGFHDGIVRDVRMRSGSYVQPTFEAVLDYLSEVHAVIQFQTDAHPACVTKFLGVARLEFRHDMDADPARAVFRAEDATFELLTLRVTATSMELIPLGVDALGPGATIPDWPPYLSNV